MLILLEWFNKYGRFVCYVVKNINIKYILKRKNLCVIILGENNIKLYLYYYYNYGNILLCLDKILKVI